MFLMSHRVALKVLDCSSLWFAALASTVVHGAPAGRGWYCSRRRVLRNETLVFNGKPKDELTLEDEDAVGVVALP